MTLNHSPLVVGRAEGAGSASRRPRIIEGPVDPADSVHRRYGSPMTEPMRRNKVAIVGAGGVGATLAYASLIRGVAHDVVLYDMNAEKIEAEVLDLRHGLQFVPTAEVNGSDDVAVCEGADVIAITAGAKQKPGQTRLELAGTNVEICRRLIPELLDVAPNAVLLLVTNPVDVITYAALKFSGLPVHRVFGSGTVLDSSRLRDLIARHFNVAPQSVHAFIAGEHGDSEFPLWSTANIGSVPVQDFSLPDGTRLDDAAKERMAREVVTAAERIIRGKGATNYAVGLAATRIIEAIVRDENGVLPVCSLLDGRYGISDVCLSLPSIVNHSGVAAHAGRPDVEPGDRPAARLGRRGPRRREVARPVGPRVMAPSQARPTSAGWFDEEGCRTGLGPSASRKDRHVPPGMHGQVAIVECCPPFVYR